MSRKDLCRRLAHIYRQTLKGTFEGNTLIGASGSQDGEAVAVDPVDRRPTNIGELAEMFLRIGKTLNYTPGQIHKAANLLRSRRTVYRYSKLVAPLGITDQRVFGDDR